MDLVSTTDMLNCSIPRPSQPQQEQHQPSTFAAYCAQLPAWCSHLLQNIHFKLDEIDLCEALQSGEQLFFVTNGGATDGTGYFGWVAATVCSTLVEAKGHALGAAHLMESLRTESTFILLLVLFLLHFRKFHNVQLSPNTWLQFCDNSTAVKRMQWVNIRV
eukprot:8416277-Ditylum_brightwellii.AAC.1